MKNRKTAGAIIGIGFLLLCCCLSGCSASFCGLRLGRQEELVFTCREKAGEQQDKEAEESEASAPAPEKSESDQVREQGADTKIDLNSAGLEELMMLSGVGESRAKAIMEYRTENGPFTEIEEIMQIPGIKEGIFSKIKDQITVH
ncbi:MAG: helix-hairpin-helix domain-containing protein [Lachnospiraceae bacterium]